MTRPRCLDLFCGGGGCSVGYFRAGFDVVGIDKLPQPRYPFWDVYQDDALVVLTDAEFVAGFDLIHASPVCKGYSTMRHLSDNVHPLQIADVRAALVATGKPYVIENVATAPLLDPVLLCGSMFGLGHDGRVLRRHRLFESNVPGLTAPGPCACKGRDIVGVYGDGGAHTPDRPRAEGGGVKVAGPEAATALGVDWTDHQPVLAQMIPPAYTEHLGHQLLAHITQGVSA